MRTDDGAHRTAHTHWTYAGEQRPDGSYQPLEERVSTPSCSACLGTRQCWVCEGTGQIETAADQFQPCPRCGGTGVCTVCEGQTSLHIPLPRREVAAGATVDADGDTVTIRAYGEFDIDSASTLAAALDDATSAGVSVVLDLARVTFLDMFALRSVVEAMTTLTADGRTLRVVNASPLITKVFLASDLTDLLSA
jgi:anti-anti-sigma factor